MERGFSLIELIVVITILSILATISFIGFGGYLSNSRDTTRKSDVGKIKQALNEYKEIVNKYPIPSNYLTISNSGTSNQVGESSLYVLQGILSDKFDLSRSFSVPKDPKNNADYFYSVTSGKYQFQLGLTLENDGKNIAYVDGNYKYIANDSFPSLLLALNGSGNIFEIHNGIGDGSINRQKFIINGGSYNLPYNFTDSSPQANGTSVGFSGILNEQGIDISKANNYKNCSEIYENGKYLGAGIYQSANGTIDCTNWDCEIQPTYTSAVFSTGSPLSFDVEWQNISSTGACYYYCSNGRTTKDCN